MKQLIVLCLFLFIGYSWQQCMHGSLKHTITYRSLRICLHYTWSSICRDFWDDNDASVVCRQLGKSPYGAIATYGNHHLSQLIITNLNCTGDETTVLDCPYNVLPHYNCSRRYNADVICQEINTPMSDCNDGDIRLEGGQTEYEGRVEICLNKAWGTVCSNSFSWTRASLWGSRESKVVCRQLGHMELGSVAYPTADKRYGQGSGPIFITAIHCGGQETSLLDCQYSYSSIFCDHSNDAAVKCEAPCQNGTVRLYSESGSYFRRYGRVQVCVNNTWGTICDDFWDDRDASVVCRMLGYSSYGAAAINNSYTEGVWYVHINDLNCTGSEESLWDCPMNGIRGYSCNHTDDSAVICQLPNAVNSNCTNGDVRLTDGSNEYEGRVEFCVHGVWGSVCDANWYDDYALSVCKQLGYQGGKSHYNSYFGIGTVPIVLYSVFCDSYMTSSYQYILPNLANCEQHRLPYNYYCNNYQEVGVVCEGPCTNGSLDLYSSSLSNAGIIRVCINGLWFKVCGTGNTLRNNELASVICSSLGFSPNGAKSYLLVFLDYKYPFGIFNMRCNGNESDLLQCQYDTQGSCLSDDDTLSVFCQEPGTVESPGIFGEGDFRLHGNSANNTGILQVFTNGVWATVCNNKYYWTLRNTNVLCSQFGYTIYDNSFSTISHDGRKPTSYIEYDCDGAESRLSSCESSPDSSAEYCYQAVHVTCARRCKHGTVALNKHYYGIVLVCVGGIWHNICRNNWTNADASVICKQLGFSPYGAIAVPHSWYYSTKGYPFLKGYDCNGTENHIIDCPVVAGAYTCQPGSRYVANVVCPVHGSTYSNCTDYDIRLVGGSTPNEGRVEVCINNAWGTVTYFTTYYVAPTVCNQLGYLTSGVILFSGAYFGEGTGPVLLTDVWCSPTKSSLSYCNFNYERRATYRNHNNDIGVRCKVPCESGDIRIYSSNPLVGPVQVCVNGTWGSICDDYWSNNDARVACRQLGFPAEGATAYGRGYESFRPYYIIDLNCKGNESTVWNCSHNTKSHHCYYGERARVRCSAPLNEDNCTNGDVRLVGGQSKFEGQVEICFSGSWGSVCRNGWDQRDAAVACWQLGHTSIGATTASFDVVPGPIHPFSFFSCTGNEAELLNCTHYTTSCSSRAGIKCLAPCTNGDVHLRGDWRYNSFGRVEVCLEETWGTICDDYWDNNDASVICKQLGFSPYGAISKTSFYNESLLPHTIFNMSCNGSEATIFDCLYSTKVPVNSECNRYQDASVICQDINVPHYNCTDYDILLVGGASPNEGKVLMCLNGVWGTLCDETFSKTDAQIVCYEAGYSGGGLVYSAHFANSSNEILLVTDIDCSENDTRIEDCSISHYTRPSSCDVQSIVAVRCHNCTDGDLRIVPYTTNSDTVGRVEVCSGSAWGSICSDFFHDNDAKVACKQLGYFSQGSIAVGHIGDLVVPLHINDLNCTGNESTIEDCPSNGLSKYNCDDSHDAAISCNEISVEHSDCIDGDLRLSSGSAELSGRVEVCYSNVWFVVCVDNFNSNYFPTTICKQLNHSSYDATGYLDTFGAYSRLPYIPYEFTCNSSSERLWSCIKSIIDCSNGKYRYAGVTCQAKCEDGDVRLNGSTYNNIGAVQVCIDGEWSSVCGASFDRADATVVCTHLGFYANGAVILPRTSYQYLRHMQIRDFNCSGNEANLWNCSYTSPTAQSCWNAAIICQVYNDSTDTNCTDGSVRLVGGINELEGNVEICYSNFWGAVCHDSWSTNDAKVVCTQLGHRVIGATALTGSYFGHDTTSYIINNLRCYDSTVKSLLDCTSYNALSAVTRCGDGNAAGVVCLESCNEGEIRLTGSSHKTAGRIEICVETVWTTICDQNWDLRDAKVACRELGYSPYGALPTYGCYTEGQLSFGIASISCTGNEKNLFNCSHNNPSLYNCRFRNYAGLLCQESAEQSNCTDGEVRLVDGNSPHEGRVEVCVNEAWGVICSNGWDISDGNVVCNQLGHLPIGVRVKNFGPGSAPILMSHLECSGSEKSLLQCNQRACYVTGCTYSGHAGIICEPVCTNGSIRLGNGAELRGRVEVCYNGSWVTICSHQWTVQEATVICSQLGYSRYGSVAISNSYFNNEWPIGIYELQCAGNESSLWDCKFTMSYDGEGCTQSYGRNDAVVFCMSNNTQYDNCTDGDIRLIGGGTRNEGNVQICYRNVWGSICDDYWDSNDGNVVCNQLGLQPYGSYTYHNNYFNASASPSFVYGRFYCSGFEETLLSCQRSSVNYLLHCSSREIAGVKCIGLCTDGSVSIRGRPGIGRVEVCVNETWATVCDKKWDDNDAAVICRQIGYSSNGAMAAYGDFLIGPFPFYLRVLYGVNCTGSEESLFDCPFHWAQLDAFYEHCAQIEAGVICQDLQTPFSNCSNGELRLRGGSTPNQGRVEVCINNVWGSVCHYGWGIADGNVVCKQLGYQRFAAKPKYWSFYGSSSLPIMLAYLDCTGSEETLLDCYRINYVILYCNKYQLAGVECEVLCTDGEIRIVGSSNPSFGRVEVCVNETWGTICDHAWNDNAASVICKQQGFSPYGAIAAKNGYSNTLLPTNIESVTCSGNEDSIMDCVVVYGGENSECDTSADAEVICQDISVSASGCEHGELRLVDGPTNSEGRVEICINGVWGTVCDDGWSTYDANVVCNQLGYYPLGATTRYGAFYGSGSGPIFLSNLWCNGNEKSILQCSRDIYSVRSCHHYEDAGVKCIGSFPVYLSRSVGSMLGGQIIMITGPTFTLDGDIVCVFGQNETPGAYLSHDKCFCVVPMAASDGIVDLNVRIKHGKTVHTGKTKFRYVLPFDNAISIDDNDSNLIGTGDSVNVTWNESALTEGILHGYTVAVNITMMLYNTDTNDWESSKTLASDVPASFERAEVIIPDFSEINDTSFRLSQIRVSISNFTLSNNKQKKLLPPVYAAVHYVAKAAVRYVVKETKKYIKNELKEGKRSALLRAACEVWHKYDTGVDNQALPPCPCNTAQATVDDRYNREDVFQDVVRHKGFKRKAATNGCYRQSNVSSFGPSQQCCYGDDGNILTGTDGGSAYRFYPNSWSSLIGHFVHDVVPHYLCCDGKYFSGCESLYYDKRPNDNCSAYPARPPPARTFGDPHLVSLDGTEYTFNGHGEFILAQSLDNTLMIQVRLTEPSRSNDSDQTLSGSGTVITAIVAKHNDSDTVQFEMFNDELVALVNGDRIDFAELSEQQFRNLTVSRKGNQTYSTTIASGATITVTENNNMLSDVSVTLSDSYLNNTIGLLGQYNGKQEDDLLSRNETITSSNATIEEIHYQFGLTWIISNPFDSLFTYDERGSWNQFYKPDYEPAFTATFNDSNLEANAKEICGDDKLCIFDIAATGDLNIGEYTKQTGKELTTISELLKPAICNPPCAHGACVSNNSCSCANGYIGTTCNEAVYQDCEENFCLNGATCQIIAGAYLCLCSEGFTGPNCSAKILISSISSTSIPPTQTNSAQQSNHFIVIAGFVGGSSAVALACVVVASFICACLIIKKMKKTKTVNLKFDNKYALDGSEKYEMS